MELKRYWQIIIRSWWIILILTLIGLAASYQYYKSHPAGWQTVITVNVRQMVTSSAGTSPNSDRYFSDAATASQYDADDFKHIFIGNIFLDDVSKILKEQSNLNISGDGLKGSVTTDSKDREVTITIANDDNVTVLAVTKAIGTLLNDKQQASKYLNYGDSNNPIVTNVIDLPTDANKNGGRTLLLAAVYVIVGLLAGVALAFLLAYLDDKVRTTNEVEELLGLKVLSVIPVYRGRPANIGNSNEVVANQTVGERDTTSTKQN